MKLFHNTQTLVVKHHGKQIVLIFKLESNFLTPTNERWSIVFTATEYKYFWINRNLLKRWMKVFKVFISDKDWLWLWSQAEIVYLAGVHTKHGKLPIMTVATVNTPFTCQKVIHQIHLITRRHCQCYVWQYIILVSEKAWLNLQVS